MSENACRDFVFLSVKNGSVGYFYSFTIFCEAKIRYDPSLSSLSSGKLSFCSCEKKSCLYELGENRDI